MLTLAQINAATTDTFVALLDGTYEHSPWIAQRAAAARPFDSLVQLKLALAQVVRGAGREAQLALIRAHPELAGKALQKDAEAGKGTFVSLMGLDRAKQQAEMLVQQANDYLSSYGAEADLLRAIANYITERDR